MSDFFDLLKGHTPDFSLSYTSAHGSFSLSSSAKHGTDSLSLHASAPLSIDILPSFLQVSAAGERTSVLTASVPTREPSVDWGDVLTWVAEGTSIGAGLGLVFGTNERPFQALGGGLLMAAGMGLLLEMVDRLVRDDHEFRWLRITLSLVTGLLMGLDIQFGPRLDRSGVVGSPPSDERNPTIGVGP